MILSKGMGVQGKALASVPAIGTYRVDRVAGPEDAQALRLSEMGMVPGAELSVLSRSNNGTVVVKVGGCRMALARGMADYVYVK